MSFDGVWITGADFTGATITKEQKRILLDNNLMVKDAINNAIIKNVDYTKHKKYVKNECRRYIKSLFN